MTAGAQELGRGLRALRADRGRRAARVGLAQQRLGGRGGGEHAVGLAEPAEHGQRRPAVVERDRVAADAHRRPVGVVEALGGVEHRQRLRGQADAGRDRGRVDQVRGLRRLELVRAHQRGQRGAGTAHRDRAARGLLRAGGVVVGGGAGEQRLAVRRVLGQERVHGGERGGQRAHRAPAAGLLQKVGPKRAQVGDVVGLVGLVEDVREGVDAVLAILGEDLDRRRDLDPVLRVRGDAAVVALGGLGHGGAVVGAREQVVAAGLRADRDRDQRRRLAAAPARPSAASSRTPPMRTSRSAVCGAAAAPAGSARSRGRGRSARRWRRRRRCPR